MRVQFESLIVFHLIINDINDRIRTWAALLPADTSTSLLPTPSPVALTPKAPPPSRTSSETRSGRPLLPFSSWTSRWGLNAATLRKYQEWTSRTRWPSCRSDTVYFLKELDQWRHMANFFGCWFYRISKLQQFSSRSTGKAFLLRMRMFLIVGALLSANFIWIIFWGKVSLFYFCSPNGLSVFDLLRVDMLGILKIDSFLWQVSCWLFSLFPRSK